MPSFVVGVDGGTTKTIALVADDQGHILAAGRGGDSNWTGPDVEIPMRVVVSTVQEALVRAGLTGDDVGLGVFGLAGADWPEDHERREAVLSRSGVARRVIVKFDVVLSGSVFKGQGPLLIDTVTQAIHRVAPRAHIVPARFEPAVGGVLLAYDALGVAVNDEMYHNLTQTIPDAEFFSTVDGS